MTQIAAAVIGPKTVAHLVKTRDEALAWAEEILNWEPDEVARNRHQVEFALRSAEVAEKRLALFGGA